MNMTTNHSTHYTLMMMTMTGMLTTARHGLMWHLMGHGTSEASHQCMVLPWWLIFWQALSLTMKFCQNTAMPVESASQRTWQTINDKSGMLDMPPSASSTMMVLPKPWREKQPKHRGDVPLLSMDFAIVPCWVMAILLYLPLWQSFSPMELLGQWRRWNASTMSTNAWEQPWENKHKSVDLGGVVKGGWLLTNAESSRIISVVPSLATRGNQRKWRTLSGPACFTAPPPTLIPIMAVVQTVKTLGASTKKHRRLENSLDLTQTTWPQNSAGRSHNSYSNCTDGCPATSFSPKCCMGRLKTTSPWTAWSGHTAPKLSLLARGGLIQRWRQQCVNSTGGTFSWLSWWIPCYCSLKSSPSTSWRPKTLPGWSRRTKQQKPSLPCVVATDMFSKQQPEPGKKTRRGRCMGQAWWQTTKCKFTFIHNITQTHRLHKQVLLHFSDGKSLFTFFSFRCLLAMVISGGRRYLHQTWSYYKKLKCLCRELNALGPYLRISYSVA